MRRFLVIAATLAAVAASGCNVLDPDDSDDLRERLAESREKWDSQGIDDYEYVLRRLCFCGFTDPARVVVRDGVRIEVTDPATGEPLPSQFAEFFLTVEELFDFIEDAIDADAHSILVEYDATYGYPTSISIDYSQNIADEEMAFQATSFLPHR